MDKELTICPECGDWQTEGHRCRRCVACNMPLRRDRKHECSKQVLGSRIGAEKQIENQYDLTKPDLPPCLQDRRTYGERLRQGFYEVDE